MTSAVAFVPIGSNEIKIFGLTASDRACRFAREAKLSPESQIPSSGRVIIANLAFAWDPAWLRYVAEEPGLAVTQDGRPILVHCTDPDCARQVAAAIVNRTALPQGSALRVVRTEDGGTLYNHVLRKREQPYVLPLTPETAPVVERASYDAAYKGITDLLTLYLWRGVAFHLTRWAARAGLSPNMVTAIGVAFCIGAFFLFLNGYLWTGLASGLAFMVLDTVDGKLARCTGTSSKFGRFLDHGIDQVHPPLWYWAWGQGLNEFGDPLAADMLWGTIAAILVGYVVQRLVEGIFTRRFGGLQIHAWQRIDSRFRLITARRNPNMVILFASLLIGEPGWGLIAVAVWTVASCIFHVVRLVQAFVLRSRGVPVTSWLA